jgi:D-cysteine desulfhydrase family pyridoxal phosphate-dependent enzyme
MDTKILTRTLSAIPRISLAEYPTPLEPLPHLSAEMGSRIFIKRDDYLGPGMGGNKTRKLEFLLADAQEKGCRKVVTFGGLQSNHARLTAAAAQKLGLETHLFYFEKKPKKFDGNLLLNRILGAKMHFIPLGGGGGMSIEATIRLVRWISRIIVGRNYFIPVGGHTWLGCLGYVQAAQEIDDQARKLGLEKPLLVLAAGSGGTLSGLMAGVALINSPVRLMGIDVGNMWKGFPASIARLAEEICIHLGESHRFSPDDVPLIESAYVGDAYGIPSPQGMEALHRLAGLEGIPLDPVYTAKAFSGMLDIIEKDQINSADAVIFLHTGGLPALFAFPGLVNQPEIFQVSGKTPDQL